ncbi:MAG: hypothetical protein GY865_05340, partial [candidate division Zixibacteria bacterium]|nr:hypothetical protein [candidate division Zixibacteria bacterium]
PAIVYALAIFLLSSVPGMNMPEYGFLMADKLLHFLEYALFAVLIFRSFSQLFHQHKLHYVIIISSFFLILFALLDEYYQKYIPGRESDVADVILDVLGASLILFLLWVRQRRLNQKNL